MKVKGFIIRESRPFGIQTSTPPPHLGTGRSHVIATELFPSTHKGQQQPEQIPKKEMREEEHSTHMRERRESEINKRRLWLNVSPFCSLLLFPFSQTIENFHTYTPAVMIERTKLA